MSGTALATEPPRWLTTAHFKARLNERWFRDAKGRPHENNWHHVDWLKHAERRDRLVLEGPREHSKTHLFATLQPLAEIRENVNLRVLIISSTYDKAQERTRVLREHIGKNPEYRRDAPHVRLARQQGDEKLWVQRPNYWIKEPTVTSTYAGASIGGGRFDLILGDDVVDYLLNAKTPEKRKKISRWWRDEVENSVAENGRIWVIGTHQHHKDLYEELKADPGYHSAVYAAVDEEDTGYGHLGYAERNPGFSGGDELCLWPSRWSYAAHMAKKDNPATHDSYLRQQQQIGVPETGLVFRKPLMDAALGRGKSVRHDPEAAQYVGLDPGYGNRAAMLCFQERAGDRVDLWREHSFTQVDDSGIAEAICGHGEEYGLRAVFVDAEDPGLAAKIRNERDARGFRFDVVSVPFGRYKRLAVKTARWMLEGQRFSWRAEETIVHRPGGVRVEPSIFRREVTALARDPNDEDLPLKGDDHGPDAMLAYCSKFVKVWIRATEQGEAA